MSLHTSDRSSNCCLHLLQQQVYRAAERRSRVSKWMPHKLLSVKHFLPQMCKFCKNEQMAAAAVFLKQIQYFRSLNGSKHCLGKYSITLEKYTCLHVRMHAPACTENTNCSLHASRTSVVRFLFAYMEKERTTCLLYCLCVRSLHVPFL